MDFGMLLTTVLEITMINYDIFQETNIIGIEENNKSNFVKRMIKAGDINVAIDSTTLHLFKLQETASAEEEIDLTCISTHDKISMSHITELAREKTSGFKVIIVSIQKHT